MAGEGRPSSRLKPPESGLPEQGLSPQLHHCSYCVGTREPNPLQNLGRVTQAPGTASSAPQDLPAEVRGQGLSSKPLGSETAVPGLETEAVGGVGGGVGSPGLWACKALGSLWLSLLLFSTRE